MRDKKSDEEEAAPMVRSGIGIWERWGILALSIALLTISLPALLHALWDSLFTWLAKGEIHVSLPVRSEALADPEPILTSPPPISALEGSYTSADFVVQFLAPQAHLQLTLARAISAAVLICAVLAIVAVAIRVVLNRSVFRLLSLASAYGGVIIVASTIAANLLEFRALRTIATGLHSTGAAPAVFPENVLLDMNWPLITTGVALLVLALVLRAAGRQSHELSEVVC